MHAVAFGIGRHALTTENNMHKTNRIQVDARTRWEIFERDKFTCRWCFATGEGVVLELDHITPVVNGGTNDFNNLVTACHTCNAGKGGWEPAYMPAHLQKQVNTVDESKVMEEGFIDYLQDMFSRAVTPIVFNAKQRADLKQFRKFVEAGQMEWAIYATQVRMKRDPIYDPLHDPWKYLCRVLYDLKDKNKKQQATA